MSRAPLKKDLAGGVLIVDDQSQPLRVYQRIMMRAGVPVLLAQNSLEAERLLSTRSSIDVVMTDLVMPDNNGIDLIRGMREQFSARPWIQFILMTGHASVESAIDALHLRVAAYLRKPMLPKEMVAAVQAALDRARRDRESLEDGEAHVRLMRRAESGNKAVRWQPEQVLPQFFGAQTGYTDLLSDAEEVLPAPQLLALLANFDELRAKVLEGAVEPDAVWQMLLELLRARFFRKEISVTSLCFASKVPVTTALRKVDQLVAAGYVSRMPDELDRRRSFVSLTDEGAARVLALLQYFSEALQSRQERAE